MKHASERSLDLIDALLGELRALEELTERKRGIFYRGSHAFLHFHEDPAGIFADLEVAAEFQRFRVSSAGERRDLLRRARSVLGGARRGRGARSRSER